MTTNLERELSDENVSLRIQLAQAKREVEQLRRFLAKIGEYANAELKQAEVRYAKTGKL